MSKKVKLLLISIFVIVTSIFVGHKYYNKDIHIVEIIGTLESEQDDGITVKTINNEEKTLKIDKNNNIMDDLKQNNKYVFIINSNTNSIINLGK